MASRGKALNGLLSILASEEVVGMRNLLDKKEWLVKEYDKKLAAMNKQISRAAKSAMSEEEWDINVSGWIKSVLRFNRKTKSAMTSKDRVKVAKDGLEGLRESRNELTKIHKSELRQVDKLIDDYRAELNRLEKAIESRDKEKSKRATERRDQIEQVLR